MSKISIALCTYNGAKYLEKQIESFLRQTRLPDELVICDDCSRDETPQIIKNFCETSPFPVRLHVNETNLGSTKNFERAISYCRGDLIFLCDQDDVWLPTKIAETEKVFAESEKIGLVFSNAELVDENLESLGVDLWQVSFTPEEKRKSLDGKFFEVLLRRNVVTGATAAFRRDLRECFAPIPTNIPYVIHDGWIALVISAVAEIRFIEKPLIKYRQHPGQQLGIDWRLKQNKFVVAEQIFEAYAKSIAIHRTEEQRLDKLKTELEKIPQFKIYLSSLDNLIEGNLEELREKIRHYEVRKDLPGEMTKRLFPIFREILSGRYHRFSKGFLSAAKDLAKI